MKSPKSHFLQITFFVITSLLLTNSTVNAAKRDSIEVTLVTLDGTQHKINAISFAHEVISPRDAASGLPTGKRQHKPITITKAVDKASPLLLNILTTNENISEWRMDVYRETRKGNRRELVRSIQLVRPSVCGVRTSYDARKHREREHISFCYQKITWTWQDEGTTSEDDWTPPDD